MDIPVLETERLRLREILAEDLDDFSEMNSDPDFTKFFGTGKPLTRWESWNVMAMLAGHWVIRGFGFWIVEEKDSNAFVGRVGIWHPDGWPGTEIGWGISPKFWGKGYATEAAEAAKKWAFDNLDVTQLISVIHPDNEASKRVAIRIGETYQETMDVNGKISDIYSIQKPS